jgi:NADH-quinone oxidoreductase subunit M
LGAFKAKWWFGAVAVLGVIFGAAYFLWYYERSMFGPLGAAVKGTMSDLQPREKIIAVSLSVMILWIGLYPSPFLRIMNGSIQALVDRVQQETKVSLQDNRTGRGY